MSVRVMPPASRQTFVAVVAASALPLAWTFSLKGCPCCVLFTCWAPDGAAICSLDADRQLCRDSPATAASMLDIAVARAAAMVS